jgi:hypothetical protein
VYGEEDPVAYWVAYVTTIVVFFASFAGTAFAGWRIAKRRRERRGAA